eukprot:CAMPEP_0119345018 /NCGR_PEP_ID=MMETSP1333-20130426/107269_1 /TAXON_ID=418940 /ORGANISM="Scyphosphaera apsteinii, Strain RCC1455" /LENGTH=274 /DNA_ID=CAMNT_0007357471 /DNA_START=271 /DNA_END=1099 /DNA_ORIENTATION=-
MALWSVDDCTNQLLPTALQGSSWHPAEKLPLHKLANSSAPNCATQIDQHDHSCSHWLHDPVERTACYAHAHTGLVAACEAEMVEGANSQRVEQERVVALRHLSREIWRVAGSRVAIARTLAGGCGEGGGGNNGGDGGGDGGGGGKGDGGGGGGKGGSGSFVPQYALSQYWTTGSLYSRVVLAPPSCCRSKLALTPESIGSVQLPTAPVHAKPNITSHRPVACVWVSAIKPARILSATRSAARSRTRHAITCSALKPKPQGGAVAAATGRHQLRL